jgi:hypothetical protein
MADAFAESKARLEQLLELVAKERDPVKCDQLAIEIRRILDQRSLLRDTSRIQK